MPSVLVKMLSRDSTMARSLGSVRNHGGTVKREVFVAVFGDVVRELNLGQFVVSKNVPVGQAKEVALSRFIPTQELVVTQRTSEFLAGADGAIKIKVADIKRGKSTDVEIISP